MITPTIGQLITHNGKLYAVVEVLDCSASFDLNEERPRCAAVVVSPVRSGVVLGRTRKMLDDYELADGTIDVPKYTKPKMDLEI